MQTAGQYSHSGYWFACTNLLAGGANLRCRCRGWTVHTFYMECFTALTSGTEYDKVKPVKCNEGNQYAAFPVPEKPRSVQGVNSRYAEYIPEQQAESTVGRVVYARYSVWVYAAFVCRTREGLPPRGAGKQRWYRELSPSAKFHIWQGLYFCPCRNKREVNSMTIYDELKARGLIAQVTDEEEIKEVINNGKATFYIGFDCTADSLTAGHFMALTLMKRLQQAGNRPIALIGGGTTMIGDPSGRNDMRKMLTKEDIDHNAECFKRQMERFIEFGDGKAMMLNNADWLLNLNYIELLREVGPCFSVNNMLRAGVLQAAHGERPVLPRVQLHDHAELRLLPPVPELRLQHGVRR